MEIKTDHRLTQIIIGTNSGEIMSDTWGEFERIIKEHRERLIKDQQDMDREINFALFGFGFCVGLIVGYLI